MTDFPKSRAPPPAIPFMEIGTIYSFFRNLAIDFASIMTGTLWLGYLSVNTLAGIYAYNTSVSD